MNYNVIDECELLINQNITIIFLLSLFYVCVVTINLQNISKGWHSMKKRTTLVALGIILSSQILPVAAHADDLAKANSGSAEAPPTTAVVEQNNDSNFAEEISVPVTSEEQDSETTSSKSESIQNNYSNSEELTEKTE